MAAGLESGGFQLLVNRNVSVKKNGESIIFAGVDDALLGKPDLNQALIGVSGNHSVILLVHEPDYAEQRKGQDIDLQLSGHSHAGQVRLPFAGPILTSKMGKIYHAGLNQAGNSLVYTNRGLGTTIMPIRFLARPEITVITLVEA